MPDYVKTIWVNGGPPGISAENLNKLETQYDCVKTELQRTDGTSAIKVHGSNIVDGSVTAAKVAADVATQAELDNHANNTSAHGATSAATANRIILRDANGRAQVATPAAASDIATKGYVDSATRLIVLTPGAVILPSSGAPGLSQVNGTNFPYYVLDFDQAADETAYWEFIVPADFVSQNVTISAWWLSTVTSGAVTWALQTGSRGAGAAFDAALGAAQTVTTTTGSTAGALNKSTFPAFNPGWTAGQIGIIKLYRDADNASDTMAADARLVMLEVRYTGR